MTNILALQGLDDDDTWLEIPPISSLLSLICCL